MGSTTSCLRLPPPPCRSRAQWRSSPPVWVCWVWVSKDVVRAPESLAAWLRRSTRATPARHLCRAGVFALRTCLEDRFLRHRRPGCDYHDHLASGPARACAATRPGAAAGAHPGGLIQKRHNGSATPAGDPARPAAARTVHIAPKRRHSRAEVGLKQPQSVAILTEHRAIDRRTSRRYSGG